MVGEWLDTREIADLLGVSRFTVYRWLETGLLAFSMIKGRPDATSHRARGPSRRVKVSDLEAFRDRWGFRDGSKPYLCPSAVREAKPKPCDGFLRQAEAAYLAGLGQTTIAKYISNGKIPTVPCPARKCSLGGRATRHIERSTFVRLLEQGAIRKDKGGRKRGVPFKRIADVRSGPIA